MPETSPALPVPLLRAPFQALYRWLDRWEPVKPKDNPWLQGNYGPVHGDRVDRDLPVEGVLPPALYGLYLRNGANPALPVQGGYHWFDGDGMVHGVRLGPQGATYLCHQIQTRRLAVERAMGETAYVRIGELVGRLGLLRVLLDRLRITLGALPAADYGLSSANTAVVAHAGQIYALVEIAWPYRLRIRPDGGLETLGATTDLFGQDVPYAFTAHPRIDPETGELGFVSYQVDGPAAFGLVDAAGKLQRVVPLPMDPPRMIHDFVMTASYAVIPDMAVVFDPQAMAREGGMAFQFRPNHPCRLGLLRRDATDASQIRWFPVQTGYVFHWANAWEEGEDVVVVGSRLASLDLAAFTNALSTPWRWRLRADGSVEEGPLDDADADFPVIDPRLAGRRARYAWFATARAHATDGLPRLDGLRRVDLLAGGSDRQVRHGDEVYGGEFTYVPAPAGGEGEGWLLGFVYDERAQTSWLRVYDSATLQITAQVRLLRRVPYGFHGTFLPSSAGAR